jgi:hypothetical protein
VGTGISPANPRIQPQQTTAVIFIGDASHGLGGKTAASPRQLDTFRYQIGSVVARGG